MKSFACVLILAAFVVAEPPRYRAVNFRSERQEAEREPTTPRGDEAPYPPAGFKPSKEFKLISRQEATPPATSYGVPADSYGAPLNFYMLPQVEYGVPEQVEPRASKKEKEEEEDVESLKVEDKKGERKEKKGEKKEKLEEEPKQDAEIVSSQGAYYVVLPGGQLQRVQFETKNDIRNMAYTARLQYKSEDRAPIYVYTAVPQYSESYVQLI